MINNLLNRWLQSNHQTYCVLKPTVTHFPLLLWPVPDVRAMKWIVVDDIVTHFTAELLQRNSRLSSLPVCHKYSPKWNVFLTRQTVLFQLITLNTGHFSSSRLNRGWDPASAHVSERFITVACSILIEQKVLIKFLQRQLWQERSSNWPVYNNALVVMLLFP